MTTKETLLALFEKNRGHFISGEYIAQNLGVSRTAVWKAGKKLQKEGFDIAAVTNRGYCLSKDTDILSVPAINEYLSDDCNNLHLEVFRSVDSTNNICKQKANAGESNGYVAIASSQSSGRGRRGRTFYSPADTGVYVSMLIVPEDFHGAGIVRLTTMTAVAVCRAIEKLTDKKASIKWVNDIYVDGRKVSGILSEASYNLEDAKLDCVVVGIGVNLYPPKNGFPDALADTAGSILDKPGSLSRNKLVAEILNNFWSIYLNDEKSYVDEYRDRSFVLGKEIDIITPKEIRKATAIGINDDCSLQVRYEDDTEAALSSGEISVRVK